MTDAVELLRLVAFDAEDIAVLSAHVQEAELRFADMAYLASQQRFAMMLERYDWQAALKGVDERAQTGVHFDHVIAVSTLHIDHESGKTAPDKMLTLLSIMFQEDVAPSGYVILTFAEGAAIRLKVECLDAQLRDMGPRWSVANAPDHGLVANGETESGN